MQLYTVVFQIVTEGLKRMNKKNIQRRISNEQNKITCIRWNEKR
ncbi:MAG: hypothetical protein JWO58_548 [Chitinophagaceae bacterium]|nr:hypothetical protein [Chitinophagaceae bacterium]